MVYFKKFIKVIIFLIRVNWLKTLYFNFKFIQFNQAIKLPVLFFGNVSIISKSGEVAFEVPPKFGMVQIGKDVDHNPISSCATKINIIGKLTFNGHCIISGGSTITVWRGELNIGKYVSIGSGVQIKVTNKIILGDYTRVVALCTIMDTNVHYVKDIQTGFISRNNEGIVIEKNCWINQGAVITKGTVLPEYSIAARNSFLNKNYKIDSSGFKVLAGSPAKVISHNKQRIFDYNKEIELNAFFLDNNDESHFIDSEGPYIEPEQLPHIFKLF